jgi:hypothetical protein
MRAREAGGSAVAHFRGSRALCFLFPGACAPGFMLPPASQVPRTTCLALPASQVPRTTCLALPASQVPRTMRLALLLRRLNQSNDNQSFAQSTENVLWKYVNVHVFNFFPKRGGKLQQVSTGQKAL